VKAVMAYCPGKYRDKREKVLGVKKRGMSFTVLAVLVSASFFTGIGFLAVPPSIEWWRTRNLEDAIYKLQSGEAWPAAVVTEVRGLRPVKAIVLDRSGTRLVVTFDKTATDLAVFTSFFERKGLAAVLLNRVDHRHATHAGKQE
jgi:hypothetical protein